jgi:hypothetical protein
MAEKDFHFNGWIDSPEWVKPGEPVKAEVVNRPVKEVFEDVNILGKHLYDHLHDYNNPHRVSLEQLGFDTDSATGGNLNELLTKIVNDIAGSFVAEGMDVDLHSVNVPEGYVEVLLKRGRAYRQGEMIDYPDDRIIRIPLNKFWFPIAGELKTFQIINEPNDRFYSLSETPLRRTTEVVVDVVYTEKVTRGTTPGGMDELANEPVRKVLKVWQGDTVYQEGKDFQLKSNAIDWSLGGAEPNPGSTYYVTYVYGKKLTKNEEYWDGSPLRKGQEIKVFVAAIDSDGKESPFDESKAKSDKVNADGWWYKIYWDSVPGATKYRIYVSIDGDQYSYAGETSSTSFQWYGARDTNRHPEGGGSLNPASGVELDDQPPAGIVLNEPNGDGERWLRPEDGYPGLVIVNYEYLVPNWAILQISKKGLELLWGEIDSKGNPQVPHPTEGAVPIAKFWVPALDPSKFKIYDIKAKPPKARLLQSILNRLDTLEDEVVRIEMVTDVLNKDSSPKKGVYADPLTKPDHLDMFNSDYNADYTGNRVISKKINHEVTDLDDPSKVELTHGAKVWKPENGSEIVSLALYGTETVYKQDTYTRTIDLDSAMANTENREPKIFIYPWWAVHQGGWLYVGVANFNPSEDVTITLGGVELGKIRTDIYGRGGKWFKVPKNYIDESLGKRILNAATAQVRSLAHNLYHLLKSAERSLWPARYIHWDNVVARWRTSWTSWEWGGCCCGWCHRDRYRYTRETTVVKHTMVRLEDKLGLSEQSLGSVNLSSFIISAVKAEDQYGKHAVRNIYITTGPILVPLRAPKLTKHTEVTGFWQWYTWHTRTWRTYEYSYWWDPIAESWTPQKDMEITHIGIKLAQVPDDPENKLRAAIGVLENGLPGSKLWEKEIDNSWVRSNIAGDGWLWIPLDAPLRVKKGQQLYVLFGGTKPGYRAYIAKLGDYIPGTNKKLQIKVNPNQVFFTSSNQQSWTAVQDTNLCFGIKCAIYKGEDNVSTFFRGGAQLATVIDFPEVELPEGATAVALHSEHQETPDGTGIAWFIGLPTDQPGVYKWRPIEKDRETPLGANITKCKVRAVLKSNNRYLSPKLGYKGVSLSHFAYANDSQLVTVMLELSNESATKADLTVRAIIPEGQQMKVWLSADDGAHWIDAGDPVEVEDIDLNEGIRDYKYEVSLPDDDTNKGKYRIKIKFTSDGIIPSEIVRMSMILR